MHCVCCRCAAKSKFRRALLLPSQRSKTNDAHTLTEGMVRCAPAACVRAASCCSRTCVSRSWKEPVQGKERPPEDDVLPYERLPEPGIFVLYSIVHLFPALLHFVWDTIFLFISHPGSGLPRFFSLSSVSIPVATQRRVFLLRGSQKGMVPLHGPHRTNVNVTVAIFFFSSFFIVVFSSFLRPVYLTACVLIWEKMEKNHIICFCFCFAFATLSALIF